MKVLCAGDLHIGRRSSKLPIDLDGSDHSGAAAWETIVATAVDQQVDLVALSGDLVDRANRYFEAIGPLERGLRKLSRAGIQTYAVSGNHDFDVLPKLADAVDVEGFHLVGRGGQWERITVAGRNGDAVHLDGWSFPQEYVSETPLNGYSCPSDDLPVLGLLHADLDQPRSMYGPVSLADLQRQPVTLWLLGHIHAYREIRPKVGPVVLYPGTPQALDPGETGAHVAWLAEMGQQEVRLRQIPVSTVKYQNLMVDLTGIETPDALQQQLVNAVRDALSQTRNKPECANVRCLCCRITLTGRTGLHRQVQSLIHDELPDLAPSSGNITAVVENVAYDTRPALELSGMASRNDPPGEVARLIHGLTQSPIPNEYRVLISDATKRLQEIHFSNHFNDIAADDPPTTDIARELLLAEAWSLLDSLVSQKEGA